MKPIDISGRNGIAPRAIAGPATPVRASEPVRPARLENGEPRGAGALSARDAGDSAPIDAKRVEEIRKAVEEGRYPVVPTQIADAMIAAGYLLRVK